jgi:hypothetical protein
MEPVPRAVAAFLMGRAAGFGKLTGSNLHAKLDYVG